MKEVQIFYWLTYLNEYTTTKKRQAPTKKKQFNESSKNLLQAKYIHLLQHNLGIVPWAQIKRKDMKVTLI